MGCGGQEAGERISSCQDRSDNRRARLERAGAASASPERDEAQVQAPPGGSQRGKEKTALLPGSDVEGERAEGCRIENGGEHKAGPHGQERERAIGKEHQELSWSPAPSQARLPSQPPSPSVSAQG